MVQEAAPPDEDLNVLAVHGTRRDDGVQTRGAPGELGDRGPGAAPGADPLGFDRGEGPVATRWRGDLRATVGAPQLGHGSAEVSAVAQPSAPINRGILRCASNC